MQTALRKDRDVAVDFIKAFAILGVVLIHVSTGAYANLSPDIPLCFGALSAGPAYLCFSCAPACCSWDRNGN